MNKPTAGPEPERSVVPTVAISRSGLPTGAIVAGAIGAGLLLFTALEARRQSRSAPAVVARGADALASEAPPPLFVPPAPAAPPEATNLPAPPAISAPATYRPVATTRPTPAMMPTASPAFEQAAEPRPRVTSGASLVIDNSQPGPAVVDGLASASASASASAGNNAPGERARAGAIANRSTTVPQGTLIPAVLETAFNSTSAGFARALVQRDIHGFDGQRILIPRGSRLIGEYRADATRGQNRALINWSRLIRPDGVTIALDSPVADALGAGGVKAKVDTHFLERFGGTILQSVLDVGVNLASRSTGNPVIVALPGAVQGQGAQINRTADIPPTLRVRQGTSVSVFVARDLDFTDVEARQ